MSWIELSGDVVADMDGDMATIADMDGDMADDVSAEVGHRPKNSALTYKITHVHSPYKHNRLNISFII